jgi:hypothetical protein
MMPPTSRRCNANHAPETRLAKALLPDENVSVTVASDRLLCETGSEKATLQTSESRYTRAMWNVTITEFQDANALDPIDLPPGAFCVSTQRFNRTVEYLDLQKLVGVVNRMQSLNGHTKKKRQTLSAQIPRLKQKRLTEIKQHA